MQHYFLIIINIITLYSLSRVVYGVKKYYNYLRFKVSIFCCTRYNFGLNVLNMVIHKLRIHDPCIPFCSI
jgi:hypothetical protein